MSHRLRLAAVSLLFLVAAASPLAGDWLVTVDGRRIETRGPWELRENRVVFTEARTGRFSSLRLEDVDLEASREASKGDLLAPEREGARVEGGGPPSAEGIDRHSVPARLEELTPEGAQRRRERLTDELDEERPADQLTLWLFDRPLVVGGAWEINADYDGNFRLDPERDNDRSSQRQRFELEFFYLASPRISAFFELRSDFTDELLRQDGDLRGDDLVASRGQAWVHFDEIGGRELSLQIGRQNFRDSRQFWWGSKLDSIRLVWEPGPTEISLAVAQELARTDSDEDFLDPDEEDVLRLLGSLEWKWTRRHRFELFALRHLDRSVTELEDQIVEEEREDEVDGDYTWLGARFRGRWENPSGWRGSYWVDLGRVEGREKVIDYDRVDDTLSEVDEIEELEVRGWVTDIGITFYRRGASFTLGYARTSGDADPEDGVDRSFRQTGLEDNRDKWEGVESFQYYGEILDPELSNLEIATAGVGFGLLDDSSLDVIAHYYRQIEAAPFLRDTDLRTDPSGEDPELGWGLDLIVGFEEWRHFIIKVTGSAFLAGAAFGAQQDDVAYTGTVKVKWIF